MAFTGAYFNHMITCGDTGFMKQFFYCFVAGQVILGYTNGRILPLVSIFGYKKYTSFDSIRVEKKCTKLKEEYFTLPFV